MARIRLLVDAREGVRFETVEVSRSRAAELVNGGQAERAAVHADVVRERSGEDR